MWFLLIYKLEVQNSKFKWYINLWSKSTGNGGKRYQFIKKKKSSHLLQSTLLGLQNTSVNVFLSQLSKHASKSFLWMSFRVQSLSWCKSKSFLGTFQVVFLEFLLANGAKHSTNNLCWLPVQLIEIHNAQHRDNQRKQSTLLWFLSDFDVVFLVFILINSRL